MVLYGITLVPLTKDLRDAYPNLLSPFYANDAVFNGPFSHSAAQLRLLMDRKPHQVYLPEPSKLLLISDKPKHKEAARREFERSGLNINYLDGRQYLGAYLGPREELYKWVWTKVEAWAHGVRTLAKIANSYPQSAYARLGVSFQFEW